VLAPAQIKIILKIVKNIVYTRISDLTYYRLKLTITKRRSCSMYKKMIVKAAALVTALVALNVALGLFGYGMALPMWAMYAALIASIIVLLAFAVGIIMHGSHECYMCCHDGREGKNYGCDKSNCK